ncbi:hypothetical protein WN944_004532 [Citrus x changshan-huyou]|uniref:Uncharacterized protein n=1 Tax=Citrus x changshan-huyou TaxID=2935761 RepID=A0AAP0M0K0_9ROSI
MAPATRITRAFSYYFVILVSEPSDFSSGLRKTIPVLSPEKKKSSLPLPSELYYQPGSLTCFPTPLMP